MRSSSRRTRDGQGGPLRNGQNWFYGIEVSYVGGQLENSGPVMLGGVAVHLGHRVGVEVVSHQHDRTAELNVGIPD